MAAKDTKTAYAFCSDCVKQVTFIRHGEAEHNVAVRETGSNAAYSDPRWEDAALTEDGLQQAMQLQADLLKTGTKFDIVLVSPLMRTLQTAIATFATEPDSFRGQLQGRPSQRHGQPQEAPASRQLSVQPALHPRRQAGDGQAGASVF